MRSAFLCLPVLLILVTCSPADINKYQLDGAVKRRTGKWVEISTVEEETFISSGTYRKGHKVRRWKATLNGRLYQKEKIRGPHTKLKYYYPGGVLKQKGRTTTQRDGDTIHWYYTGKWRYYDEKGPMIYMKVYE